MNEKEPGYPIPKSKTKKNEYPYPKFKDYDLSEFHTQRIRSSYMIPFYTVSTSISEAYDFKFEPLFKSMNFSNLEFWNNSRFFVEGSDFYRDEIFSIINYIGEDHTFVSAWSKSYHVSNVYIFLNEEEYIKTINLITIKSILNS